MSGSEHNVVKGVFPSVPIGARPEQREAQRRGVADYIAEAERVQRGLRADATERRKESS